MPTKCDACDSPAAWIGLITRATKTKRLAPPARFRLCNYDAETLAANDPNARLIPLEGSNQ